MPPLPGEELQLTLFADIHYYLNAPGSKPQHDRFDRASYVYLFHNPVQRRSRLEVANHAGTPDQDAFNGYLDTIILSHVQKQPSLVTITVDGIPSKPASPHGNDQSLWTLPSYDLKKEQKYLYRLHTLDVYFWTAQDADRFVEQSRRLLQPQQLKAEAAPAAQAAGSSHAEHPNASHPVIQQLEQMAISEDYRPRADTNPTGPSAGALPGSSTSSNRTPSISTPANSSAPAAYNPAAPTAPEPIAHREKTPPPPEAQAGTGLSAAATMDNPVTQYANHPGYNAGQPAYTPQQSYFSGVPQSAASNSFPPPPPGSPPAAASTPRTPAFFPGPPQQAHRNSSVHSQASQPYQPGLQSPGFSQHTPLASPSFSSYSQASVPPPPPGGPPSAAHPPAQYSSYTYSNAPPSSHTNFAGDAVHSQFYRPTEAEIAPGGHIGSHAGLTAAMGQRPEQRPEEAVAGQPTTNATGVNKGGRFDVKMDKVEKGVNRWLRKLDQKI